MTEPEVQPQLILFSNQWRQARVRRGDALLAQADAITKEITETMKKEGWVHSTTVMEFLAKAQCLIAAAHAHYAAANVRGKSD
jgi:hypothetical protein